MRQAGRVSFKRCYLEGLNGDKVKSVQLHCFADASERDYGAAVYRRVEYESTVECQIISSKTRIALLPKQTIHRLELLSNLAASRLLKSMSQASEAVRMCLTGQFSRAFVLVACCNTLCVCLFDWPIFGFCFLRFCDTISVMRTTHPSY